MIIHVYNKEAFGKKLKDLREKRNLKKVTVQRLTTLHPDTLRKIERGETLPRYDTLYLLSNLYGFDLASLLDEYSVTKSVKYYYKEIDKALINNDPNEIKQSLKHFQGIVESYKTSNDLICPIEAEQTYVFFKTIASYYDHIIKNPEYNKKEDRNTIIELLRKTHDTFSVKNFDEFYYTIIETRLLILLSKLTDKYDEATKIRILKFVHSYCTQNEAVNYNDQLQINLFYNLSYAYYNDENDVMSLAYAEKGIDFAIKKKSLFLLPHLYSRKGIALYYLNKEDYTQYFEHTLNLLKAMNDVTLYDQFLEVFEEKYGYNK